MTYYEAYLPLVLDDFDRSYPSPERQLLWRLDDLCEALSSLPPDDVPFGFHDRYCDEELRYVPTEMLTDPAAIERAIELAKADLVNKYHLPNPDGHLAAAQERFDAA